MDLMTSKGKNKLIKNENKEFQTEEKSKFKNSYIKIRDISVFSSFEGESSAI